MVGIDLPKFSLDLGVDEPGGMLGAAIMDKLIPPIPNQLGLGEQKDAKIPHSQQSSVLK